MLNPIISLQLLAIYHTILTNYIEIQTIWTSLVTNYVQTIENKLVTQVLSDNTVHYVYARQVKNQNMPKYGTTYLSYR